MTADAAAPVSAAELFFEFANEARRPDPPFTVSEWADRNRYLSSVSSAEPGRWRTSRTPYLREIMDCLSAYSPVEEVAVMKGVQIGMSEAGFNFVGYAIHHNPGPMMYVMPTIDMAKKFSRTRIDPMILASPALRERIRPARARDSGNTVFSKDFDGGVLIMTGANSGAGLRGLPVGKLVLDEVDGYPESADEDGDPVTLAVDRTSTFRGRRKIFKLSTPTIKSTSRIGRAFREGDQRYYHVACERCGTLQPITWDRIKWEPDRPDTAAFVCSAHDPETGEVCGHRHPEHRKAALLREEGQGGKAKWIPTATPTRPRLRSYHVSALYSPWYTWAECAYRFIAAKDDPALLQPFNNNILGQEWDDESGEKADTDSLFGKREDYPSGAADAMAEAGVVLPQRIAILTAGVDVQPDRLEVEVVGWGRGEESWNVDYQVFAGDPSAQEVWDQLDDYLGARWPHAALDTGMPIAAAAIDTGGANTMDVYNFVRPREGRRIWGIKGYDGKRPVWPRRPSRNNKGKINLYQVGVDSAKEVIMNRLARTGAAFRSGGACHFSVDRDREYFDQLTAETKRTKFIKGFKHIYWWKPDGARNEALDCRVYAYAALQGLILSGFVLNREANRIAELLAERGVAPEPEPAPPAAPELPKDAVELMRAAVRALTNAGPEAAVLPDTPMPPSARSAIKPKRKRARIVRSSFM